MAGIALLVDLLKKNSSITTQTIHSTKLISASIAASAAAASVFGERPFASRFLFGDGVGSVAYADAGAEWAPEDYIPNFKNAAKKMFQNDSIKYSIKEYPIELKPLFSAFGLRAFGMTTLRSFLMFYLPLLEPRTNLEEDEDEDFLQDAPPEEPTDLVVPFQKSVKQIVREITVSTTRRVLERVAVHYVSRRMAWKLLKDIPVSARRKAARGMPGLEFFCRVSRTTFRGHLLGIAAAWLVQVGIDIYRSCKFMFTDKPEEAEKIDRAALMKLIGTKICITTVKCGGSLIFASIGAGIGAFFHPSIGQWIGCAAGDAAGSFIITILLVKGLHLAL
ncbi:uncharacterized protein LOC113336678 [Papaver somniferum]|uniref:uncharacterized protein LOC113336678 n=1 Tax=Papaver somniferum TaxID=3469 RepID=UPI000E6FA1F3|nr:uncharacterized protein LOC113336678 [Papaver somniferum]